MNAETYDGPLNNENPVSSLPIENRGVLITNNDGDIIASPYSDRHRSLAENAIAGIAFLGNTLVLLTILFSPEIALFTAVHLLAKH